MSEDEAGDRAGVRRCRRGRARRHQARRRDCDRRRRRGGPAFAAAYGELIGFVKGNCEFTELNVTTKEYSFEGLPQEVPAGTAVITMDNQGAEFHEVLLLKVNDGVTDTADRSALAARGGADDEGLDGQRHVRPSGRSVLRRRRASTPGRYIAVCFLPQGATPEVMAQMDGPGAAACPKAPARRTSWPAWSRSSTSPDRSREGVRPAGADEAPVGRDACRPIPSPAMSERLP